MASLGNVKRLMGDYASDVSPEDLLIILIDGTFGSGTIKGRVVELALPSDENVIETLRPFVDTLSPEMGADEKKTRAREVANAISSSTVFHEGAHALIDSKPGSKFAKDLEVDDPNGETGTMIDEGITYALQGVYAKEPYLVPDVKQDDRKEVKLRKRLGEKIRPRVKELIDNKKVMDSDFLKYCLGVLRQIKTEQ